MSRPVLATEIFGRPLIDGGSVSVLLASLGLNALAMVCITGLLYYRQTRDRDHTFMMVTLNLVVFLVGFFMNSVEVGVGFGFGLFALFGIVRYRTESVPVREMSYLFAVIALGLTNAIGATVLTWADVLIANGSLILTLGVLSQLFWRRLQVVRHVTYDQLVNLRPDRRGNLVADLGQRTGLRAIDIEVVSVNLLNETAELRVTCRAEPAPRSATVAPSPPAIARRDPVTRPSSPQT